MIPNHSPWLHQLKRTREVVRLGDHAEADVCIVGGGIAGVVTAYFTLSFTDKRVILLEADKVAHGATGHNAGQITSYFERPLYELAEEFGLVRAAEAQHSVESAWTLLEGIVADAKLQAPYYRFTGYEGTRTLDELIATLKNNECRVKGGLTTETVLVAKEWKDLKNIPPEYDPLYTIAPQKDILELLETDNTAYVASAAFQKGCMNSALFTEELVGFLLSKFKDRFSLFENSPVKTVVLQKDRAELAVGEKHVTAERVVLCTNGFEYFTIQNKAGKDIDTKFHHLVRGRIAYMAGYIEPLNRPPTAISYYMGPKDEHKDPPTGDPYFYLTRRPHEQDILGSFNLICAGGPEKVLPNQATYSREDACNEDEQILIDEFLRDNYRTHKAKERTYTFCWHGLMGYTPNGIRRVGFEPRNPVLLYNLGCNGVGILPSIYGGKRISQILHGEALSPSIFDPIA